MRHSLHIFIGDDLSSVAESVNSHLKQHCNREGREFAHVATWMKDGSNSIVRQIDSNEKRTVLSSKTEGIAYFQQKHNTIVVVRPGGDVSPYLYVCIYILLYDKTAIEELGKLLEFINDSGKYYRIDVYGISEDLARLFCSSESEILDLVYKNEEMKNQVKIACSELVKWKDNNVLRHFLLIQNSNVIGLGLNLDKDTLIRILGEYARLSTTNYSDFFPVADIDRPDVMAFGISAYWFSPKFFQNNLFCRCLIKLFERERVDQHTMNSPNTLLQHAQAYIDRNLSILSDAVNGICTTNKVSALSEFDQHVKAATDDFLQIIDRTDLSLPEKRGMLALLLGDDDELLDDSVLLKQLPTLDDCMKEALDLFVDENNHMVEDGTGTVLSVTSGGGKVLLPLEDLRNKRTIIRQSQSFIRQKKERLREIEKGFKIAEESHKRLTEEGFVYGENTFKLVHDVVEKPLKETYQPNVESAEFVDLRKGFSVIRNQGKLGACASFSMASIFEYILNQGDTTMKHCLSPRFLYYNVCDKNIDGTIKDKGSSFYNNIQILGEKGICEENLCPYDEKFNTAPTEDAFIDASTRLVTEAKNVEIYHRDLTAALTEGYPIGISLKVFNSFGKDHKGFIFRPTEKELKSTDFGYHAMVLCGYSEKEKVYIVRNSWGEAFGDKGYCYIPFSYIEDKNLCCQACIVTGISCGDIKGSSTDAPKFDIENKDIEYAVLRVLIDEEQQQLTHHKDDYDESYRNYMKLLGELTNKKKRDAMMEHALSKIQPLMTTKQVTEKKQVATNKKFLLKMCFTGAGLFFIFAFLLLILLPEKEKIVGSLIPSLIGLLPVMVGLWLMIKYPSTKTVEETKTISEPEISSASHDMVEKKFLFAGRLIDSFCGLRNDLSNKYKYLQSFIRNLETWLKEERNTLEIMDEKIRQPFFSLFSENQAEQFLSNFSNKYLDDLWLYKRFVDYDIMGDAIQIFKNRLYDDLRGKLSDVGSDFSMYDYLSNAAQFNYLPNVTANTIFQTIQNMSVPFVQGTPSIQLKQLLLCKVDPTNQRNWQSLITAIYPSIPVLANETSSQKITFVQIQKYKLNETLYGRF